MSTAKFALAIACATLTIGTAAARAQSSPKVTILNEGYVMPIEGRAFVPGMRNDGARRVASTVVLVETDEAIIVADPGFVAADVDLVAELAEAGVTREEVTHVFISHHHPDHTVRVGLFPNASTVDFSKLK